MPRNNIRVYARLKPTTKPSGHFELEKDEGSIDFNIPVDRAKDLVNNTRTSYKFKFDGILDMKISQDKVFNKVAREAVDSALDGYNATIFAYGQTGSGKTFTITGGVEKYADRGIIPRTISYIFGTFNERADTQYSAYISFLEIYNESGYDLLDPSHDTSKLEDLPKVSLMEDEEGSVHLRNLSMHRVNNEEEALNLLFLGDTNRAISETPMNPNSSRSHCIFTISIEARPAGTDVIRRSKLHLVDLAGSERVHKTNASGVLLREAKYINTSLHYLEMVIVSLRDRNKGSRQHIPYRNSMMTSVLRDSLGGNCKTTMVATVSGEDPHTDETISTCRFAQRVASIQNDAFVNEEVDPKLMIRRLKGEVKSLKQEVAFLKGEKGDEEAADEEEMARLRELVEEYVHSNEPSPRLALPNMTLTRIHEAFGVLREMARQGGSGAAAGAAGEADKPARSDSELEAENKRLRLQLQQRDNEIKILVKLAQKSGAPVTGDAAVGDGGAGHAAVGQVSVPQLAGSRSGARGGVGPVPGAEGGPPGAAGRGAAGGAGGGGGSGPDREREQALSLAGGQLPDAEALSTREAAFDWFRQHYVRAEAIEANKEELKAKYEAAKETAARVNGARSQINRIKSSLDQQRVARAMESLDSTGGEEGKGGEEAALLSEMETQKREYKLHFSQLRSLKKEIEQIQGLMEKLRVRLQRDFETWLEAARGSDGRGPGGPDAGRSWHDGASIRSVPTDRGPPASIASGARTSYGGESKMGDGASVAGDGRSYRGPPPPAPSPVRRSGNAPAGAPQLTGDSEADDDIIAFYKAKKELQARMGRK